MNQSFNNNSRRTADGIRIRQVGQPPEEPIIPQEPQDPSPAPQEPPIAEEVMHEEEEHVTKIHTADAPDITPKIPTEDDAAFQPEPPEARLAELTDDEPKTYLAAIRARTSRKHAATKKTISKKTARRSAAKSPAGSSSSWIDGYRKHESPEDAFFNRKQARKKARSGGRKSLLWGIITGSAILLVVGILLSTVFVSVTITATASSESVTLDDILIVFDASVSNTLTEQKVIPAELFTIEKTITNEYPATGHETVNASAKGKVRIYNEFSSSSQTLVKTTRFLTKDNKLYRLGKTTTVPGAKIQGGDIVPTYIEVELIADKPGEAFNNPGEVRLSIPGLKGTPRYDGFYGIATKGFSGGKIGESSVVSDEDADKASKAVTKQVYDELTSELAQKIPTQFGLINGLSEVTINSVDIPDVGTPAETIMARSTATAEALIFREDDLIGLVRALTLGEGSQKAFVNATTSIIYDVRSTDFAKGRASVVLTGRVTARSVLNPEELIGISAGQKEGTLSSILAERADIESFEVKIFPPWRFSIPADAEKIHIEIK